MSSERIFVGRRDELTRFDEVLARAQGQAVVVGQAGMGKTMLVNRMADRARHHPDLKTVGCPPPTNQYRDRERADTSHTATTAISPFSSVLTF